MFFTCVVVFAAAGQARLGPEKRLLRQRARDASIPVPLFDIGVTVEVTQIDGEAVPKGRSYVLGWPGETYFAGTGPYAVPREDGSMGAERVNSTGTQSFFPFSQLVGTHLPTCVTGVPNAHALGADVSLSDDERELRLRDQKIKVYEKGFRPVCKELGESVRNIFTTVSRRSLRDMVTKILAARNSFASMPWQYFTDIMNGSRFEISSTDLKLLRDSRRNPDTLPSLQARCQTVIDEYGLVVVGSFTQEDWVASIDRFLGLLFKTGIIVDEPSADAKLARDYARSVLRGDVRPNTAVGTVHCAMEYLFVAPKSKNAPRRQVRVLKALLLNMGLDTFKNKEPMEYEELQNEFGFKYVDYCVVREIEALEEKREKDGEERRERAAKAAKVAARAKKNVGLLALSKKKKRALIKKINSKEAKKIAQSYLEIEEPLQTDDEAMDATEPPAAPRRGEREYVPDEVWLPQELPAYSPPSAAQVEANRFSAFARLVVKQIANGQYRICSMMTTKKGEVKASTRIFRQDSTLQGLLDKVVRWEVENMGSNIFDAAESLPEEDAPAVEESWLANLRRG
jgi:hypothetical protein